jgi:hypothetical protein
MFRKLFATAAIGVTLCSGILVLPLRADEWNKETDLTVRKPISVDGTRLGPGDYVLKLQESASDRYIVQIYDQDEKHLVTTVLAGAAYRAQPTSRPAFSFYETPAGQTLQLRTYFYPGDDDGLLFPQHR